MLANVDLARDAAQEAVVRAMLGLDHLRDDARFGPWLVGIGLNLCRGLVGAWPSGPRATASKPFDQAPIGRLMQAAQQVAQLALLGGIQTREPGGRLSYALQELLAQASTRRGQHDVLDAAVLGAGLAGHQAARLQTIDEASHVRVVAREHRGELVHW